MTMPRMISAVMTPGAPRATENPAKISQSPRAKVIQPKILIHDLPSRSVHRRCHCVTGRGSRVAVPSGRKPRPSRSGRLYAIPAAPFGTIQRIVRHPDELLEIAFFLLGRIEGRNPDRYGDAAPDAPSAAPVGDTDDEPLS